MSTVAMSLVHGIYASCQRGAGRIRPPLLLLPSAAGSNRSTFPARRALSNESQQRQQNDGTDGHPTLHTMRALPLTVHICVPVRNIYTL